MRKAKGLLALALAAAIALCTGGCEKNETGIQTLESGAGEAIYLSMFSSESMSDNDVAKYWSERFTREYDKDVYIDFDGASYYSDQGLTYRELLELRMESDTPDDMYIINAEDVMAFEKKGYWMDLSHMDFIGNISESALYQSTYRGKVFSLPLSITGFGLLWNVDLLELHGLSVPNNLGEFLNVCETLKGDNILPYGGNKGFALTVPAMCIGFSELYAGDDREERISSLNKGETHVSEYMEKGYTFLNMMIEKGYLDPEQALATVPHEGDVEMFLKGECAFICSGVGKTAGFDEMPFEMKMTGVPVLENGSICVYGVGRRLSVNPASPNLDTVLDFIETLGTTEALDESAALDNSLSSTRTEDSHQFPFEYELTALIRQPGQIPNQDFSLNFNTWESIRDAARELCGGAGVEQACALLDQKQMEDIKAYGLKE